MIRTVFLFSIIALLLTACLETEPVAPVPEITYKGFTLHFEKDTSLENNILVGRLEFSFVDGDADIGLSESVVNNKNLPDSVRFNIFLFPYEKVSGHYEEIPLDTVGDIKTPPFYSIKSDEKLTRQGQNKTIKGVITLSIQYFIVPPYDTVRYEFFIRDNAGHKSNVEVTGDIGFKGISLSQGL